MGMKRKSSKYDPDRSQDQTWWRALGEGEQIECVEEQHRRAGIKLPNAKLHAMTHVIVENQVLLGDETPVASTLQRLMTDGLDRHDAIHAIGSVLAPLLFDILGGEIRSEPNLIYYQQLRELTAERWLSEDA